MSFATTIFLVRHASHGRPGVLCGRLPGVSLSEYGRAQAATLAERMAQERITAVLTSPMLRCRETASCIAATISQVPVVTEGWNEIDFGGWSGQSFETLKGDPDWQHWNEARDTARTPAGVSVRSVQTGVVAEIEAIQGRHGGGRIAVVSHSEIIKAAVSFYLGIPLRNYASFDIDPASFSTLALWPGGGKVISLNQAALALWRSSPG